MTDAELAIVVRLKDMFTTQLDKIVNETNKSTDKMTGSWKKITDAITWAKGALVAYGIALATQVIKEMYKTAETVDLTVTAFKNLAQSTGIDAAKALERLRVASQNTVSDLELMQAANKLLMYGVIENAKELEKVVEIGTRLGTAMGLKAAEGIEKFGTAISTGNTEMLRAVGIVMKMTDLTERFGEANAKAYKAEMLNAGIEKVKRLGSAHADLALRIQRSTADIDNFTHKMELAAVGTIEGASMAAPGFFQKLLESIGNAGMTGAVSTGAVSGPSDVDRALQAAPSGGGRPNLRAAEAQAERMRKIAEMSAEFRTSLYTEMQLISDAERDTATNWFQANTPIVKSQAQQFWEAMKYGMDEYYKNVRDTMLLVSECIYRTFQDIENNIGDIFFDAMMGKMKTFKEYLRQFVSDIARTLSQMMARSALGSIIGAVGNAFTSTSTSAIDKEFTSIGGGDNVVFGNMSLPGKAYGGITTGLSFAGENSPEAVVPLPGSRSIPVEFRGGGGGGNVTYIINAIDTQSFASALAGNKASIHRIVTEGLGADTQLRAAVRAV